MKLHSRFFSVVLVALLLVGAVAPLATTRAQNDTVITIAIPEYLTDNFDEELFADFEAEHGVKVEVVDGANPFFPSPASGLDGHLEAVADYVKAADVLFVDASNMSVESTRAGYFLNLAPLTGGDATLYPDDFYPAAWQSFQWDQGVWGIPVGLNLITLNYNPAAFDRAGLAYPNAQWTMDDFVSAARALTEYDENGKVAVPGVEIYSSELVLLFRSLVGAGFYDVSTTPETPYLSNPALEPLLSEWAKLESEGVTSWPDDAVTVSFGGSSVPMRVELTYGLWSLADDEETKSVPMFLPGSVVGLQAQGFAVSAGTAYPEIAYALAKYISNSARAVDALFEFMPARQSLDGASGETEDQMAFSDFSPEVEAFLQDAVWSALPASELRYGGYLASIINKMQEDANIDIPAALRDAEASAISNLQEAERRRTDTVINVATPVPTPVLGAGEIALRFGYQSFFSPLLNAEQWDQAIDEFVANDPEVGQIVFNTEMMPDVKTLAQDYDCFYLPYNAVPDLNPALVYNLDPFIDADPYFDRNDVVGNLLPHLQRDNKTWAIPISIQPSVLRYDSELFKQVGLPLPIDGWTTDAFTDALHTLKANPEDPAPFVPHGFGGTYLLMLITSYGGIPIDYRTTPPTVNFTDPATVDAIRQVLDLARDGYIKYSKLGDITNADISIGGETNVAIYPSSVDFFGFDFGSFGLSDENVELSVTYPRGNQYAPASYSISTAYISANAENPDACYRWLSFISRRTELLTGMPSRRSMLDDPALEAVQSAEQIAFYRSYDAFLQEPSTIVHPAFSLNSGGVGNFFLQQWLFRAFDRYITEDADLETELAESQLLAQGYQECEVQIPPYDPVEYEDQDTYLQKYLECAILVDPSYKAFLDGEE